jgi:drug/metabolite transporter superfamily protein YnfA
MLCATIAVIAPAWGRLIVLSGNEMTAPVNVAMLLLYVVVAMLFDWGNRGRVHPAYGWGFGALLFFAAATELLAVAPFFAATAARIAGS